jgi:hypothetical protein
MKGECESANVRECERGPAPARTTNTTPQPVIPRERTRAAGRRVRVLRATEGSSFGRLENGSRQMIGGRRAGRCG